MDSDIINVAAKTIGQEIKSLEAFKNALNDEFEKAVRAVHQNKGRLVVTGVGKSGIVAQKIVATLNSTGTPALFMHAADAIHGDIGMMQPEDIALILSKSGESEEVKILVPLIKNFGNTIIAAVGNMQSYLAGHADIRINATVTQEACPNNLAPTSSTTVQMVCGDALAVCLMHLKGFQSEDFARFHPGGHLGKRLYLRVSDLYSHNEKPVIGLHSPVREVLLQISRGRLGIAVVVDNDIIAGVITDGDIRRLLETHNNLENVSAKDFLSRNPKTIHPNALAVQALELMNQFNITQLIVTEDNGKYAGVVHLHDLLKEGII